MSDPASGVEADAPAAEEVLGLRVLRVHLGGHQADAELDADTLVIVPGPRQVELVGVGFLRGKDRAERLGGDIRNVQHAVAIAVRVRRVFEDAHRCRRHAAAVIGALPTRAGRRDVHADAVVASRTIACRLGGGGRRVEAHRPGIVELVIDVQANRGAFVLGIVIPAGIEQVLAAATWQCNGLDQLDRGGDDVAAIELDVAV